MKFTKLLFSASKTVQEERFEPLKLVVTMEATVEEGENVALAMEALQTTVYNKLDAAFVVYKRRLEEKAARLRKMREDADRLARAAERGDVNFAVDTDEPDNQDWP